MTDEMKDLERMLRDSVPEVDDAGAATRLARRADSDGLVDIAYATVDTPLGAMLVASTDRGLVRVGLPRETFDDVLENMADRLSPRILELPARVDDARRELEEYFDGSRREFDLPLDMRLIRSTLSQPGARDHDEGPIRRGDHLRRGGDPRRQPPRSAGRRVGPRCQSDPCRDPLPPRGPDRRGGRQLRWGTGDEALPAAARGLAAGLGAYLDIC